IDQRVAEVAGLKVPGDLVLAVVLQGEQRADPRTAPLPSAGAAVEPLLGELERPVLGRDVEVPVRLPTAELLAHLRGQRRLELVLELATDAGELGFIDVFPA